MLRPGDKVCFNADYFEGSKSELIKQYGTGEITSEEYADARFHLSRPLHPRPLPLLPLRLRPCYINIRWDDLKEEHWEYVDLLCLVEEREKRDIYKLFEQVMNK